MVLVLRSDASQPGSLPTGTVAMTAMQPLAPWAVPRAGGAEAAAAVVIGARLVTATAVRHAARWVNLMIPAPLPRGGRTRSLAITRRTAGWICLFDSDMPWPGTPNCAAIVGPA